VPMEWLYVTTGMEEQSWMEGMEDVWRRIGGRRIVILSEEREQPGSVSYVSLPNDIELFRETDGQFGLWGHRSGIDAILVRPDRYVYAGVGNKADHAAKRIPLGERLFA